MEADAGRVGVASNWWLIAAGAIWGFAGGRGDITWLRAGSLTEGVRSRPGVRWLAAVRCVGDVSTSTR